MLSKLIEEKDCQINKATHSIFRTAYYIAKYNRPFDDHLKLVQLKELNDLVELKNQTAENIVSQLINCLHTSLLDENYLQQHWVSFVSDGASILLGKKNGVAKKLTDKYPLIFSWHCMNHRSELAVND
ncbi:Hypothetical protein CINCED_3A014755 [Cinara cedri]|uniref:Uncharacterized protein n=1 Tax=Cinara cedri TaxID=506608 RepID=A0A5E4N680_9HEMI|nr:Hypothetical protein CINCED_3A014755 [Cinara cedri]